MTAETVGAALLELRSQLKLSRRNLLEQLGGKPWSTGRIGDLEKGKHPWSYFRPREREMLLDWLERQGVGVAELSTDSEAPTERTGPAVDFQREEVANGHLVYGDDGAPVLEVVHEDDEPHLLETSELVVTTARTETPPAAAVVTTSVPPSNAQYHEVAERFERVRSRLNGRQSPFPWPTHYRLDTAPPSDLERVQRWCERTEQWLDDVDSGRVAPGEFAAGPAPAVPTAVPDEAPPAGAPGAAVTPLVAAPTDDTGLTVEPSLAPQQAPAGVGAAALSRDGLRRLTNSELQTFKHCRRRWWLSWYRGLRLKDEPQTGVRALGTWVHDALARWYVPEGETPEDPRLAFNELVQAEELALLQATSHLPDTNVATKVADFQKDAELGRAMLEGYVQWLAETGADVGYTVVAPEQVLSTVLECSAKLTVQVQGRLDVRLRRDADLVHLFMDHKTVGNFTDPARRLPMDEQMKTYLLLEQAQADGAGYVDGALYNLLRRVKRTAQARPPFYDRLEVRHNPTTVATFRERLKGEALTIDLVERGLDDGVDHHLLAYPSPSARCSWGCEFFALCPMFDDGSRAEDFVSEHYVAVNPLDRYDREETES